MAKSSANDFTAFISKSHLEFLFAFHFVQLSMAAFGSIMISFFIILYLFIALKR